MADRIITAEALITAKDGTGDTFTKIGAKLAGIGKNARSSVQVEELAASLQKAQKQYQALERLQSNMGSFAKSRTAFNQQKASLEQLAKSMRAVEAPTKSMESKYQQLQASVARSSAVFERQKVAMMDAKRAAEGFGSPLGKIASEQARLKGVIEGTTRAIEHQANAENKAAAAHLKAEKAAEKRAHGIAHHGIANYAVGAAAGYVGAHSIMTGIEHAIHSGAELQAERVALKNAGRTPEEIDRMERASRQTVAAIPTSTYTENMKVLNETVGAFGSVEHAIEHLTFMQQAASVLHTTAGDKITDSPGELGNKMARFFEMRGTAGNAEVFQKEASEMMKAMVFTGGNFNPHEMVNFATQAKSSLQNYSIDFLSKIVPSLITENKGEKAGTYANAFTSVILGKANDKRQAEAWQKYGLINPKQMIMKGGTPVAWTGGAVYHTDTALRNPLEYGEKYFLPALAAHGVKVNDPLELTKVLGTLFRNSSSNAFANEVFQLQNRKRLHKDAGYIGDVEEPDAIYKRNLASDPNAALKSLTASLDNLMSSITAPAMESAAKGMMTLAGGINVLSNAATEHPDLAMGAGALAAGGALYGAGRMSYSLANGFGLGTSATALGASATQLSAAAAALEGAAGVKGAAGAVGGPLVTGAGAVTAGGVLAGAAAIAAPLAAGIVGHQIEEDRISRSKAFVNSRAGQNLPDISEQSFGQFISGRTPAQHEDRAQRARRFDAPFRYQMDAATERRARLAADDFRRDPEAARGRAFASLPALAPSGPVEATVRPDQITAKLEGQASVTVAVKVTGPGEVTGQYAYSTGNIRASTGTTGIVSKMAANGHVAGPN